MKATKDERILARRQRLANRRRKDVGPSLKDREVKKVEMVDLTKKQIMRSRDIIDAKKEQVSESVSNIKLNREHQEMDRRRKEEKRRNSRMDELERELIDSTKLNRDIESKWNEVASKNIPQELYQSIAKQYSAASSLLNSKDNIIKQLQDELKFKDEVRVLQPFATNTHTPGAVQYFAEHRMPVLPICSSVCCAVQTARFFHSMMV